MSTIEFNVPEGYVLDRKASTRNKVVYKKEKQEVFLPNTWEEFCHHAKPGPRHIITYEGEIRTGELEYLDSEADRNIMPSKEVAISVRALMQLLNLREVYKEADEPGLSDSYYNIVIGRQSNNPYIVNEAEPSLFSFKNPKLAQRFYRNFRDLLKEAGDLVF